MRRADRLFRIVQYLRGRRLTTAAQLAGWLNVTPRTIYRDVRDLCGAGTPIEGEAGVGYRLRGSMDLPPLMFDHDEVEALVVGCRMVEAWSSPALAASAAAAVAKISAAVSAERRLEMDQMHAYAPAHHIPAQLGARFETLRQAIRQQKKVEFAYARADKTLSFRQVRPLSLFFWGDGWTLAAWCELREDFRNFRLDRIVRLKATETAIEDVAGTRLADYMRRMACE